MMSSGVKSLLLSLGALGILVFYGIDVEEQIIFGTSPGDWKQKAANATGGIVLFPSRSGQVEEVKETKKDAATIEKRYPSQTTVTKDANEPEESSGESFIAEEKEIATNVPETRNKKGGRTPKSKESFIAEEKEIEPQKTTTTATEHPVSAVDSFMAEEEEIEAIEDDARTIVLKDPDLAPIRMQTVAENFGKILPDVISYTQERPLVAETFYYHGYVPAHGMMLSGTARPYAKNEKTGKGGYIKNPQPDDQLFWPAAEQTEAVCRQSMKENPREFPHAYEQLLRCFTWWQWNKKAFDQKPVYVIPAPLWGTRNSKGQIDHKIFYLHDTYHAMEDIFGVRFDAGEQYKNVSLSQKYAKTSVPFLGLEWASRTYVMDSKHATTFREGVVKHVVKEPTVRAGCPNQQKLRRLGGGKKPMPRIAWVNRDGGSRNIGNAINVTRAIEAAGYGDVVYMPKMGGSFADQVKFFSEYDIVIGPHGAGFTSTIYQPECGSLIEIFRPGYYAPNFFGSLAALSGKHHFFVYGGGKVVNYRFRGKRDLTTVPEEVIVHLVGVAVDRWRTCCKEGFRGRSSPGETHPYPKVWGPEAGSIP